jgi:CXXX repeat peptide maturase
MQIGLQSLIILLDRLAVPFCNYPAPAGATAPMELATLKKALAFASRMRLRPLCVLSGELPPAKVLAALRRIKHQKLVPWALYSRMPGAWPVINLSELRSMKKPGRRAENVILRVQRQKLGGLANAFARLKGHFKRINVRLLELEKYTENNFREYRRQCALVARQIAAQKWPRQGTECNLLTDRLVLRGMNNCGAGLAHVTVAPNGCFYLCPAFYYQDEADAVGSLNDGLKIKNPRLLTVEGAPICRSCDAFQCLRCVWLNKRSTEEINTPSRQQCVAAHLERAAVQSLRKKLLAKRSAGRLSPMEKLDYLDPLEKLIRKTASLAAAAPGRRRRQGARRAQVELQRLAGARGEIS